MSDALPETGKAAPPPSLELTIQPGGRGDTVVVIAKIGDDEVYRDKLDLNRANQRSKFARAIHQALPRFTPAEIDSQLLKLRQDLERQTESEQVKAPEHDGDEVETSGITRPELIIRRGFVGMAIPRLIPSPGGPVGVWTLYANHNGKRTATELEPSVIAGTDPLHVDPFPCDPSFADVAELRVWSKASRNDWLAGNDRVTTAAAFIAVMDRIDRYVELPNDDGQGGVGHAATLALWVLMTYTYPIFQAVPYLYLAGPAGSGKTRTMDLIGRMAFRPMFSSNTTAANLFRSLHTRGGTLLLDEAERLKDNNSPETRELNLVLLSGYRRGGRATRLEKIGDTHRSVRFDCYSPKLLACIRGLKPELSSRCISIRLSRAAAGSRRASRSLDDTPEDEQTVRDKLHAWTLENAATLLETDPPPTTLANRDAERWQPLLRIAKLTGDDELVETVIDHATKQVEQDVDDVTPEADPSLLAALHNLTATTPKVSPGDVLEAAKDIDPDAFTTDWNPRRVSSVLRRYGFRTVRNRGRRIYRLEADQIAAIAARYGYPIETDSSRSGANDGTF